MYKKSRQNQCSLELREIVFGCTRSAVADKDKSGPGPVIYLIYLDKSFSATVPATFQQQAQNEPFARDPPKKKIQMQINMRINISTFHLELASKSFSNSSISTSHNPLSFCTLTMAYQDTLRI